MSYRLQPHIDQAKKLIEAGDPQSLVYAALELRLGIELVCYEKLKLRLGYMASEGLRDWRPHRVIEAIQELVDPDIHRDAVWSLIPEDAEGNPQEHRRRTLAQQKGIDPRWVRREWNKLGSFLHVHSPKDRAEHIQPYANPQDLERSLGKLIVQLEDLAHSKTDMYLAQHVVLTCPECGQLVVRNARTISCGDRIKCGNPDCKTEHVAQKIDGRYKLEPCKMIAKCEDCGAETEFPAHKLSEMSTADRYPFSCSGCGANYAIRWNLGFGKVAGASAAGAGDLDPITSAAG